MVANHFTDIGFDVTTTDEIKPLIQRAMKEGENVPCPNGVYVKWSVVGAELWVSLDKGRRTVNGCVPHFSGLARAMLGITNMRNGLSTPNLLEGSLDAWAAPSSDDPKSGLYPITLGIPDFDRTRNSLKVGGKYEFQIAAFANGRLSCFKDDDAFKQEQLKKPVGVREGKPVTFGPESFIPTGQFTKITGNQQPKAEAMISGHISNAEELTNPVGGRRFSHLLVRTYGIHVDMVADPSILNGSPSVGGVVIGNFWLSGRNTNQLTHGQSLSIR